ncbi:MAG: hypothetical protein J0M07_11355 [Anaerolineae bacterium]|jgi:hypothetical protein|nr:hypothetical protein [Chloroflexota bacterium]MBN8635910.1 hypothetical protein [Anaerolineae bacterium]
MSDQVMDDKVDELVNQVTELPLVEQMKVVERIMARMKYAVPSEKPRTSLYGLLADLGPGPSEEDIAEVRRDMMRNFPREDF